VRVNVKGIGGSGKSTFSRELAERLGVPYLELDAIHHGPNWTETSADEFWGRDSLFAWTLRSWVRHRRQWPRRFSGDPRIVRLRSAEGARRWLEQQG